ncbi:hypothetical protein V5799_015726 [Amblyomma americanum]|uniref:Uncharacterized protein n=1 Tax=Amblyomma americanum TaxID=6943 RepID=A0AAQ4F7T7_AMBAM
MTAEKPEHKGSQSAVRVTDDNITAPLCSSILARVTCDKPHRRLRIVETNVPLLLAMGISVARDLGFLHGGCTDERVTNFSNEHRHVFRGTFIAYVDHVRDVAECFSSEANHRWLLPWIVWCFFNIVYIFVIAVMQVLAAVFASSTHALGSAMGSWIGFFVSVYFLKCVLAYYQTLQCEAELKPQPEPEATEPLRSCQPDEEPHCSKNMHA